MLTSAPARAPASGGTSGVNAGATSGATSTARSAAPCATGDRASANASSTRITPSSRVPHHGQGETLASEPGLDALQDQRTAVAVGAGAYLVDRHPHRTHDALIERTPGLLALDPAAVGKAQVGDVALRPRPLVDADQILGHE